MSIRLYHPELGTEIEAGDERQAAVLAESGWLPAPEPEARPGYQPEPVRYAPVTGTSDVPPKGGPGSGRDEWAAYAETQGLDVTDEMTRDEIIEAIEGITTD